MNKLVIVALVFLLAFMNVTAWKVWASSWSETRSSISYQVGSFTYRHFEKNYTDAQACMITELETLALNSNILTIYSNLTLTTDSLVGIEYGGNWTAVWNQAVALNPVWLAEIYGTVSVKSVSSWTVPENNYVMLFFTFLAFDAVVGYALLMGVATEHRGEK